MLRDTGAPIKNWLLASAGTIALALGIIGLAVPVLPTTPLLLLAAFCYVRSSQRLYRWLLSNKVLGPYIVNYMKHRAVARRAKILAICMLWVSLGVSVFLIDVLWVRLLLAAIGIAVTSHILSLKTIGKDADD